MARRESGRATAVQDASRVEGPRNGPPGSWTAVGLYRFDRDAGVAGARIMNWPWHNPARPPKPGQYSMQDS